MLNLVSQALKDLTWRQGLQHMEMRSFNPGEWCPLVERRIGARLVCRGNHVSREAKPASQGERPG